MRTVPAGQFKQTCLRLLDEVRETGEPLLVTKRGVPVARVVPVVAEPDWRGAMTGTGEIRGDLVAPAMDLDEWEVLTP